MDDERVRAFETALWVGGEDVYRRSIAPDCLMVLPEPPFVMSGEEAIAAVSRTPRWEEVALRGLRIARPHEGLIVAAYSVRAARGGEAYEASCTSTYLRTAHEEWRVVQHQQSVAPGAQSGGAEAGAMERAQRDAAEGREDEHGYQ